MNVSRRDFVGMAAAAGFAGCRCGGCACGAMPERLGVCSWSFQMPLDKVAAEMRKIGLKRIHLALQPFLEGDARHGAAEGAAARKRVEERLASGEWKLSATMLSFSYEDYSTLETIRRTGGIVPDDRWEANKKLIRAAAKLSAELKSPYLTLHAGFLDESNQQALRTYISRVQFIADACGEVGVKLLLESGQETAEDLVKFLGMVQGVGVNFDPANMILYGKGDPVKAVPLLARWIGHVHVKDARFTKTPGTWGEEVVWGDGAVNPPAFLEALRKGGYRGAFAVEREVGDSAARAADIATAARRFAVQFKD
ncbi:MAG: sugar phosphate isomerase/epimerase [Kiritimatiellae bacterium]|nr:sugar phosphate isomerase/epimerase [Kiritimatiellia bacterium]